MLLSPRAALLIAFRPLGQGAERRSDHLLHPAHPAHPVKAVRVVPPFRWRAVPSLYGDDSTKPASLSSDIRHPVSLSAAESPGGRPSCTATSSVPPSTSRSVIVIVISPCIPGSVVSNSTTATISS